MLKTQCRVKCKAKPLVVWGEYESRAANHASCDFTEVTQGTHGIILVAAVGCNNNRVNLCLNEIVTAWGPHPSPVSRHCAHFGKPVILVVPLALQVEHWGENRALLKRNSCICTRLINQKQANIKSEQCLTLCLPAFCCILIFSFFVRTASNTNQVLPQRLRENQITCESCFICWEQASPDYV